MSALPVTPLLARLRASPFARHAASMLLFNGLAKCINILGTGYAARCLGPANLGVSAAILALAQQSFLTVHGGYENIVVREIVGAPSRAGVVTRTMVGARLIGALGLSVAWVAASCWAYPAIPLWVKLLGVPLLFLSALGIGAAFQGLEKLPIQTAIGTLVSLVSTGSYALFFHPGMSVGSDLLVFLGSNFSGAAVSIWYFRRLTGEYPWGRIDWAEWRFMISQSWRYWLLSVVCFIYTSFQVPLIAAFLGWREAGIFRSVLLMTAGIDLVYGSLNNLMIPRFIAWHREGLEVLRRRQAKIVPLFLLIGSVFTAIFWVAAPWIYRDFLGTEFEDGIAVFRILSLGRLIVFVGQIYAYGLIALKKDHENFMASLVGAGVSLGLSLSLIKPFGLLAAAWIGVASETVVVGICVFYSFRYYNAERARVPR